MIKRAVRRKLAYAGTLKSEIDGKAITCTIKRSYRARIARLEIRPESGLTCVIPAGYRIERVPEILKSKRGWILNNLDKCRHSRPAAQQTVLKNGGTVLFLGRQLELAILNNNGCNTIQIQPDKLVINCKDSNNGTAAALLEQWYRWQADRILKERADALSKRLGLDYARLSIRGQRTRWASCSRKKNLSFNWKLLMAPEAVIDYVVIHELTHLKEMNHSKKFWNLVAEHCPGWREYKQWLKEHEAALTQGQIYLYSCSSKQM